VTHLAPQLAREPGSPPDGFARLAPHQLPLLVTGVAGVAGYNALDWFASRYPGQVVGIRQKDNWRLDSPHIAACDAEDRDTLAQLFRQHRFRSVLNCAGNCALKACELDSRLAWRTNVEGLINLLLHVVEYDARLVHASVDLVFSGASDPGGGLLEHHPTDPVTVYGKTMVAAEHLIADWCPNACVVRISLPMGPSFNGHAGAIDWIESRFKAGRPATLYFDEVRTPTYTECLSGVFESLLAGNQSGLYHGGGPRRLSLYEIAQVVNRVGGYDPGLLHGCLRHQAGPIPPRAGNVSLDSSKLAEGLGGEPFAPWPADPRLVPTHQEWHFDRSGFAGSRSDLERLLYRAARMSNMD
jgi:dTDP-4-dehydrorhamnose reductase